VTGAVPIITSATVVRAPPRSTTHAADPALVRLTQSRAHRVDRCRETASEQHIFSILVGGNRSMSSV
jgi:hypothetical protein